MLENTGVLNLKERTEQIVKATGVKLGSQSWRENLASWVKVGCQTHLHPNLHPSLKLLFKSASSVQVIYLNTMTSYPSCLQFDRRL